MTSNVVGELLFHVRTSVSQQPGFAIPFEAGIPRPYPTRMFTVLQNRVEGIFVREGLW